MKGWSWRNHGVVCGTLVLLVVVLRLLDGGLGLLGFVSIPAALLLGTAATLSTVMIAARRPAGTGIGLLYGSAVLAALALLAGVLGVARLVTTLSHQGRQERQVVLAANVVLTALSVEEMTAHATLSLSSPAQLRHVMVLSLDDDCQGTVWPADSAVSGEVVIAVPLRCAGGVPAARHWRLSTVAQLGDEVVTLVWSDSDAMSPPGAVLRSLPRLRLRRR